MSTALTIARREFASMFRLPVGWVVVALFLLLTAAVFALTLIPGNPASLRDFFSVSAWLLMPVAPAVSMRLLAEEHRTGSDEPLLTAPVSDLAVVAGKYLGACAFLVCMLAPTVVFPVVLWVVSDPKPDPGPVVAGYLNLLLQGSLYLAIGAAVSAMTSSQTLAYLATLFPILGLLLLGTVEAGTLPEWARVVVSALSIQTRASDFARGVLDTAHLVYFLAGSLWFLALAHTALASRRWR